jgi:hypothetical protein
MRPAGLMLAAVTFATAGFAPVFAQEKTIPERSQAAPPLLLPAERALLYEGHVLLVTTGPVTWQAQTITTSGATDEHDPDAASQYRPNASGQPHV